MTEIHFKNINKILGKDKIIKMRQEDMRTFYVKKKRYMLPQEEKRYFRKILGRGSESYPAGNELLVERKGNKLNFTNLED